MILMVVEISTKRFDLKLPPPSGAIQVQDTTPFLNLTEDYRDKRTDKIKTVEEWSGTLSLLQVDLSNLAKYKVLGFCVLGRLNVVNTNQKILIYFGENLQKRDLFVVSITED